MLEFAFSFDWQLQGAPLYLALCWIWDLGSAVLQGTLRICMPAQAALQSTNFTDT